MSGDEVEALEAFIRVMWWPNPFGGSDGWDMLVRQLLEW